MFRGDRTSHPHSTDQLIDVQTASRRGGPLFERLLILHDEVVGVPNVLVQQRQVGVVFLLQRAGGGELRACAMRRSAWGYLDSRETVARVAAQINEELRRSTGQDLTATA
jgi:hypothetical protein